MTVEERLKKAHEILDQPMIMGSFSGPIKAGSLQNHTICGVTTGYSFRLNNLSYRGIWVSTFEDIRVTVDGKEVPKEYIVLELKGMKLPIRDLGGHSEVFWGAEDECSLLVYQIGGLSAGRHRIAVDFIRRNDFGHTVGNGTEGYEEAQEFLHPLHIHGEEEMEVAGK